MKPLPRTIRETQTPFTMRSIQLQEQKMKELNQSDVKDVSGGTTAGDIAMGVAGGWATTVVGFAIGGPVGAVVGFGLGVAITVGYALSQ
ncbi:MAG: hypothetical protein ACXWHZ_10610 [Usitatibacter sp.]